MKIKQIHSQSQDPGKTGPYSLSLLKPILGSTGFISQQASHVITGIGTRMSGQQRPVFPSTEVLSTRLDPREPWGDSFPPWQDIQESSTLTRMVVTSSHHFPSLGIPSCCLPTYKASYTCSCSLLHTNLFSRNHCKVLRCRPTLRLPELKFFRTKRWVCKSHDVFVFNN